MFHQPLLSASELSEKEIMYTVLLSYKYSVPEETIHRVLKECRPVYLDSLCEYEEPESKAICYKEQLGELSRQLDISKETLGSMIFDCKLLIFMVEGRRSKLDKHIYAE